MTTWGVSPGDPRICPVTTADRHVHRYQTFSLRPA